jgi:pentatricopeptide repeat protein
LNRIAALGGKYDSNDANGAETPPGPTPAPAPRAAIPPRSRSPLRRPPSAGAEVYTTVIETGRAADLDDSTIAEARETLRMVSHANAERAASSAGAMTKSAPPGKRDHHRAMIVEGVRQGWPLAKLLESTPPLPHSTDINLSNCKAHLALYDVLLDAGRLHNALELLRAMKAAGLNTVGGRISHKAFMREAAKKRAVAVAFDFVTFVDYPDVRLYNMLLSVCAAAGDARSGFAAFVLMYDAGVRPDCKAYTTLISACAKAGDVEKAFETFRRMKEDGVAPTVVTYGALMDALSRRVKELTHGQSSSSGANAGAAATTTAKAKHCDVDNTNGCADDVESLLDRCFELKADMLDDGIVPDACVLNSLLSACGRAAVVKPLASEALRRAFEVYDEFEASAGVLRCDAYTYASLIQACANAGEPERGLALYERMAGEKVRRTKEVYAAAIHACAGSRRAASGGRAADLRRALRVWDDMRRSADRTTPDAMLYATLMDVAARAGERGVAAEVMDEMERDGVAPTTEVFATMAGIAAREGDVAGVEKVLDEMTERGSPPPISAFNALIAAAARRGDVAAATDACERLAAAGLSKDVNTHENLIRTAAHARDASAAWAFYDDALAAEMEPTRPMFNALVYASGRGGDLKRTFEAVDAMKARGHVPDETTWRELLSSCARHGDAALAWDTYKASRKAGTEPSEVALNIIIGVTLMKIRELTDPTRGGGAKEGDREWKEWADRAVAVYHEATVAGVRPRLATFSAMLACLRPPTIPALQAVDRDAGSGSAAAALAHAVSHEDTSHEDARKYYPLRALILYEEAQALGVVPKFHMDRDETYDIREFPPAAAEVAVLTLLRVFRRNSDAAAGDVDLPNVTLRGASSHHTGPHTTPSAW